MPLILLALSLLVGTAHGQRVKGAFASSTDRPDSVSLFATVGSQLVPLFRAPVNAKGRFDLGRLHLEPGFYKLASNDSDRVDLILGTSEKDIQLIFTGAPLQEHITVRRSLENQLLWSYKGISRAHQRSIADLRSERGKADPMDTALIASLDRRERMLDETKAKEKARIMDAYPNTYFTYALAQDAALMTALGQGWQALRAAVPLDDHRLLRSNLHAKAVLAFLQVSPPEAYEATCDSLLAWTADDSLAWCTIRTQLVTLFHTYGPDLLAEYLVDSYVAGPKARFPADPLLLQLVKQRLRVAPGAQVPLDLAMPLPLIADTVLTGTLISQYDHVLLFFFSSSCGHCHDEMPAVSMLLAESDPKQFGVVGVALDEDLDELRRTVQVERLDFPIASDLAGWSGPIGKAFGITATPSFFLLDRAGVIRAKPLDMIETRAELQRLRAGLKAR